jgi:hypothetical protein
MDPTYRGNCFKTEVEGMAFNICTELLYDDVTGNSTGQWYARSFFAYDRSFSIFPADDVPVGIIAQESIAGEFGASEDEARRAVDEKLRTVIQTKNLDGTGFYSPPGGFTYPQELPPNSR